MGQKKNNRRRGFEVSGVKIYGENLKMKSSQRSSSTSKAIRLMNKKILSIYNNGYFVW